MKLIIHRGTNQIGGSCIELVSGQTRLILDVGLPLDADPEVLRRTPNHYRPAVDGLFSDDPVGTSVDAVLLSHFHPDHSRFLSHIHPAIPVYMSEGSKRVMQALELFLPHRSLPANVQVLQTRPRTTIQVGPFEIEPILVDHSAPDSLAFLIRAEGKSFLYTGDFRAHGRKGVLFDDLIRRTPKGLDALLIEGTMVGSCRTTALCRSEADLEVEIGRHVAAAPSGPILANFSPTNMDRLISFMRVCQRERIELVVDLFTAYLYDQFQQVGWKIPALKDSVLRVLYFRGHTTKLDKAGEKQFFFGLVGRKIEFSDLTERKKRVILFRPNHLRNYVRKGVVFSKALLINSQYEGTYPGQEAMTQDFASYIKDHGIKKVQVHTSGHAFEPDLKRFVDAIKPKVVVPIHTCHPGQFTNLFIGHNVKQLKDGERYQIG